MQELIPSFITTFDYQVREIILGIPEFREGSLPAIVVEQITYEYIKIYANLWEEALVYGVIVE